MSPEQTRGGNIDHRTDIWSLGVTLYEMITGQRPFRGASDQALIGAIRDEEPEPLERLCPGLPAALASVVRRCLAKDPAERYQRAEDLLDDLRAVETSGTVARPTFGPRLWHRTVWRYGGLLGVLTLALMGAFYFQRRANEPDAAATTAGEMATAVLPRLGVLPFTNLRGDPEIDFLGYALADQVISQIGYVNGLVTRPSSAVRKYQGQAVDPREVARALHVDYVLTGSYIKDGDTLRLNLELVDVAANKPVWREPIQVAYNNILVLQDVVATRVSRKLVLQFTPQEQARIQRDAAAHPLAYHYYLRALAHPLATEDGNRSAHQLLLRSVELDSTFAPALAALGFRAYLLANLGFVTGEARSRTLADAEQALQKALSRNPELLSALSYLAVLYLETGRIEESLEAAQRALTINPNSSDACTSLGHLYRFAGLFDESERAFTRAKVLDPYSMRLGASGLTYLYHGKYEEALEAFALDPYSPFSLLWQGMALLQMGRPEEARKRFEAVLATQSTSPAKWVAEAHLAYMARNLEQGLAAVRALERKFAPAGEGGEALYHYGRLYIVLGDPTAGTRVLEQAIDHGFFPYPYLEVDPFLDPVRAEPAFKRVLAKAKARHETFKKK